MVFCNKAEFLGIVRHRNSRDFPSAGAYMRAPDSLYSNIPKQRTKFSNKKIKLLSHGKFLSF